ncbi:ribonuclease H-like domain-containing protein [Tanacetum coccineum]
MMTWNNLMNILRRHGLKWQVAMIRWNKEVSKDWEKANNYDAKEPVGFLIKPKFECLIIFLPSKTSHFARECRTKGNQDSRRRDAWNSGNKDGRRSGKQEDSKALVTIDGEGVDWTSHSEEEEDYALMACNSSGSNTTVLTRTGKIPVNTARASGTKNVSTARHSFNRQAVLTSAAMKVNTVKPIDYPHRALQNKGIVDSGCSRHMTGNKAYLAEYQDFNGGPVAFGGSKGYITGKEEQSSFTDSECLVLSPEFKLPDANQVLLRIPRQNNMYSFNLENIVPSGGLACLIAKATIDESNKWHRRSRAEDAGVAPHKHLYLKTDEKLVDKEDQVFFDELERLKREEKDANERLKINLNYHNMVAYLEKTEGNAEFHEIIDFLKRSTEDIIDAGDSEKEDESAQDYFVLPIWSSYSSTAKRSIAKDAGDAPNKHPNLKTNGKPVDKEDQVFLDELERLKRQEKDANDAVEALRKEFAQETENLLIQARDAKASSTNIVNTFSTPVSTASPYDGLSFTDMGMPSFIDPKYPQKVYKVVKALYGLHQAPRAWYATLSTFLLQHGYRRGTIDKTLFIPKDTLDYMETEDAQDLGRTRDVVDEEKENAEDVLSTAQQKVSTDKEKVSIDTPIEKDSTDRTNEGTDDQTEGGRDTQTTQTPTSTIFGDDETIAKVLLNMSQAKAVSRENDKGVEFKLIQKTKGKKKIEEEDESESDSDGIPEAEKKFKQLASDEEMARKLQEEWETEEEGKRLAEEEATNDALIRNYNDIKARIEADKLLAKRLQEQKKRAIHSRRKSKIPS